MRLVIGGQALQHQATRQLGFLSAVLALGVVCGCYARGLAPQVAPQLEENVAARMMWLNPRDVPPEYLHLISAPYVGPYYILVSTLGHYCVVPARVYTSVQDNERWPCEWRQRRPT
jgi:hypothetical protein